MKFDLKNCLNLFSIPEVWTLGILNVLNSNIADMVL